MQIDVLKFQHLGRVAASLWLEYRVGVIPPELRIEAHALELAAVDTFFGIIALNDFEGHGWQPFSRCRQNNRPTPDASRPDRQNRKYCHRPHFRSRPLARPTLKWHLGEAVRSLLQE
jgi:hypothetical protein